LGSPTDAEEVTAIRRPGQREVAPPERRFANIETQDAVETLNLLNGKVFGVVTKIGGKLIDFGALRPGRCALGRS
jgi:hypothetical protein